MLWFGPIPRSPVSVLGPRFRMGSAERALPLEQSPMLQMGRLRPEDKTRCEVWVTWESVESWDGAPAAWRPVGLVSWPVAAPTRYPAVVSLLSPLETCLSPFCQ